MALVDQLNVSASDLLVSATVPAEMPSGAPQITSPENATTVFDRDITVSGTCPVALPPIIVAIYNNGVLVGSAPCAGDGTFAVPITLFYGSNSLVATTVTVTGELGSSGSPVVVTLPPPLSGIHLLAPPLQIIAKDIFILIKADGSAEWRGSFTGGAGPYQVRIDWGDGNIDTITITDEAEHTFTHRYESPQTYDVTVTVTDAANSSTTIHIAGVTQFVSGGVAGLDGSLTQVHPVVAFVQRYVWQIYTITLSALAFLWYLEHGRHIVSQATIHRKRRYRH